MCANDCMRCSQLSVQASMESVKGIDRPFKATWELSIYKMPWARLKAAASPQRMDSAHGPMPHRRPNGAPWRGRVMRDL